MDNAEACTVIFDLNFYLAVPAFAVVAVVALIFALPPLLQMMQGGPVIKIHFDATTEQDAQFLLVECSVCLCGICSCGSLVLRAPRQKFLLLLIFGSTGRIRLLQVCFVPALRTSETIRTGLVLTVKPSLPVILLLSMSQRGLFVRVMRRASFSGCPCRPANILLM